MKEKIRQFMIGRYGTDGLNQFLSIASLVLILVYILTRLPLLLRDQWNNRKLYHYYRCPQCRQKLRVPRGRGRIQISCPRCGTQFIKKS